MGLLGQGPRDTGIGVVDIAVAVHGGIIIPLTIARLLLTTLTTTTGSRPESRRKHMRLALERKRRLALVAGPDPSPECASLLPGGVIELGAGAGCSVLFLAVANEDDGGNDENDKHSDAGDDGDDGGGNCRLIGVGLEEAGGVDDANG